MVDAKRLGAWLRSGEGIGWLAAGTIPNSLYRVPFFYLFLIYVYFVIVPFLLSFLFCFVMSFFCSRWNFVDVPLIFFCPADHVVPDCCCCLKKNQTAPRPSEHPPVMGERCNTFRWDQRLQIQNLFKAFKQVPRCR